MNTQAPPPIFGGTPDENPQDFLRSFAREVNHIPIAEKAAIFDNYLKADSEADDWYQALDNATKADWAELRAAFELQYPKSIRVQKTLAEFESELMGKILKEEELGKKVTNGGVEKWTHVVWAEEVMHIALIGKFSDGTQYISLVRKDLPDLLKQKVGAQHTNWKAFTKAISEVDIDFIVEGAARLKKVSDEKRQVEARIKMLERNTSTIVPASPTAPLRTRFAQTHITAPSSPSPANRFPSNPRTQGAFSQPGFRFNFNAEVYPPERAAAFRARIDELPHHPATEAGQAAYKKQLITWVATHGLNTTVSDATPVPLTPGTENTGTRECFTCGQLGHQNPCPQIANRGPKLPRHEQNWRRLVWTNFGAFRASRSVAPAFFVDMNDPFYLAAAELAEADQGKGEGSSA